MLATKKFSQDKIILALLSLNLFLALLIIILIALRLSSNSGEGYIVQYRASLGIGAFKTGGVAEFAFIIVFALLAAAFHAVLSFKVYHIKRQLAVLILSMGSLLLILSLIVSNALLVLR